MDLLDPLSHPLAEAKAVCLGSGRFLRAVLVPALTGAGLPCVVMQTRRRSFMDHMGAKAGTPDAGLYEVDTVEYDGRLVTQKLRVVAAGSLGSDAGMAAFLELPKACPELCIIGVGVTEAGLAKGSKTMADLAQFLLAFYAARGSDARLSVLCTDNVPGNGDAIRDAVLAARGDGTSAAALAWIRSSVAFHNSMVDRITSQREGDAEVPRAEPLPVKTLVFEDIGGLLPAGLGAQPGVYVRHLPGEIDQDHELKLCIANGIHTASVYALALSGLEDTRAFSPGTGHEALLANYIDTVFLYDILPGLRTELSAPEEDIREVYEDWRARLRHPHFGLGTFFITQNSSLKLRVRLWPSIRRVVEAGRVPSDFMAFAVAAMLRFLTPVSGSEVTAGVWQGSFPQKVADCTEASEYAGKRYHLGEGWYEFADGDGATSTVLRALALGEDGSFVADAVLPAVGAVLGAAADAAPATGAAAGRCLDVFTGRVASLLKSLLGGMSPLSMLQHLCDADAGADLARGTAPGTGRLAEVVREEVRRVEVVDVHTHLFPPGFGELCLSGVDELLTYHYLVAEYLETSDGVSPFFFYARSKREQADLVWGAVFNKRAPLSEAARGVLTVLRRLGLGAALKSRSLGAARAWFAAQDPAKHAESVFKLAGVRYAVMTNIPYDPSEIPHWRPAAPAFDRAAWKTALRVDLVLMNDWAGLCAAMKAEGYEETLEGCLQWLRDWADTYQPEYLMASTPGGFTYPPTDGQALSPDLIADVFVPFAHERKLPLALKVGAVRGVNPDYQMAGDGVEVADMGFVRHMCATYPDLKFLVTVLSRDNQHELAVLGNKFRNLHLYGCWWYCNNPSIIADTTRMRMELLGPNFTAQHSDCRVLEQLIYKWAHSRELIAEQLVEQVEGVAKTGWAFTRRDIQQLVHRLLGGGAYEDFMAKTL